MKAIRPLRIFGLACSVLGMVAPLFAAQDAGTDPALYLGTGARMLAMGRTGVTDCDSAFSPDWNPGSLGFAPRPSLALQHAALFGDALHDSLGAVYPTVDLGGFALGLTRLQVGDIERRDARNLPQGTFNQIEQQGSLSYGYAFLDYLSAGVTAKVHNLRMDNRESTGFGVDAGVLFKLPFNDELVKSVSVGAGGRNVLGPRLKLKDEFDQLFTTWRLGAETCLAIMPEWSDQLLIRVEAEKPERADIRWHGGVEYSLYHLLALRGGWDDNYLSAGAGVTFAGMTLDYAVSFTDLGLRHLATFSVALGEDVAAIRARRAADEEKNRKAIVENLKANIVKDYRVQAKALTLAKNYPEAAKLWGKVLDWNPEDEEAKRELDQVQKTILREQNSKNLADAREFMQKQNYIDVMVECQQVLDRDPQNQEAGALYNEAEKQAKQLGSKSLTTNIKMLESIRTEYQRGLELYTKGRYSEAIEHWEQVIENTPLQKQVYRFLQNARKRIAQEQRANGEAMKVPAAKDKRRDDLYKEAVDQMRGGKLKDAVKTYETLVKENPDDQEAKENFDKMRQDLINSQKKGIRW